MPGKHWTAKEVRRLRELFPTHSQSELAAILGRPVAGVGFKCYSLSLRKTARERSSVWSRSMVSRPRGVILQRAIGACRDVV